MNSWLVSVFQTWRMRLSIFSVLFCVLLVYSNISAEQATRQEMTQVCENWLSQVVIERGTWATTVNPVMAGSVSMGW